MSNPIKLGEFQQQVADLFNQRNNYDKGNFHPRLAHQHYSSEELELILLMPKLGTTNCSD